MEPIEERLRRDWLEIIDDRPDRGLWSMTQERRDRMYYPVLVDVNGPLEPETPIDGNIYAENYEEDY